VRASSFAFGDVASFFTSSGFNDFAYSSVLPAAGATGVLPCWAGDASPVRRAPPFPAHAFTSTFFANSAEAFEISLAVAEARQAPYDVALTLRSMAQLASAQGGDALEVERKSDDLLRSLGVVAVPEVLVGEPTARSAGSRVLRYGRVPSLGSRSEVRT
jgi:hypothetical protein